MTENPQIIKAIMGANDVKEILEQFDEQTIMQALWSSEFARAVKGLDDMSLIALIKEICILEQSIPFGSTSQIGKLVYILKERNCDQLDELLDWLFKNRTNEYVPYGISVPLKVRSLADYEQYCFERGEHRANMEVERQKRHGEAVARKEERIRISKDLGEQKSDERQSVLVMLEQLSFDEKVEYIISSPMMLEYFPFEIIAGQGTLNEDQSNRLKKKLKGVPRDNEWRVFLSGQAL